MAEGIFLLFATAVSLSGLVRHFSISTITDKKTSPERLRGMPKKLDEYKAKTDFHWVFLKSHFISSHTTIFSFQKNGITQNVVFLLIKISNETKIYKSTLDYHI